MHETKNTERQAADAENLVSEVKRSEKKTVPKTDSKTVATKKQGDGDSRKTEIKADRMLRRMKEKLVRKVVWCLK